MPAFGAFRPDVAGPNSGFAKQADNVLPVSAAGGNIGYGPLSQLVVAMTAEALSGAPHGSISLRTFDGTQQVYFATESTIERLAADYTWTSIETGRSVPSGNDVSFVHFGSYLLNSDTSDGFKAYSVESGGTNDAVSGAPAARFIFTANNVVFALDCDGNNRRMQSSGIGDHTEWKQKGANGKTFEDGGALICGADLKNGAAILFQDDAMRFIQFGSSAGGSVYSISKVADGRGSVGARSMVSFDGMVFFLATDGFYLFTAGSGNAPIGSEKVNRWFLTRVDQSRLYDVQAAVDPLNTMVWWRFPTLSDTDDTIFPGLLGYNWKLGEWVTATVATSALSRLATPGYLADDLDSLGPADSIDILMDSRYWQGGQPIFAGLDENYKFGTFSGGASAVTLELCDLAGPTSNLITWVTLDTDAENAKFSLGTKDRRADAMSYAAAQSMVADGRTPVRGRGKVIGGIVTIAAGEEWTYCNGVEDLVPHGGGPK